MDTMSNCVCRALPELKPDSRFVRVFRTFQDGINKLQSDGFIQRAQTNRQTVIICPFPAYRP